MPLPHCVQCCRLSPRPCRPPNAKIMLGTCSHSLVEHPLNTIARVQICLFSTFYDLYLHLPQAPDFYESVPPAPPGLEWWHYKSDVPPLPEPAKYLHDKRYKTWGEQT